MNSNSIFDTVARAATAAIYSQQGTAVKYTPIGGTEKTVSVCLEETDGWNIVDGQTFDAPEISGNASQFDRFTASLQIAEVPVLLEGDTLQFGSGPIFSVLASTINNDGVEWSFQAVRRRAETNLFDLDGQRAVWGVED